MFLIIAKQLQKNLQLKKTGICMLQMLNKSARQTAICTIIVDSLNYNKTAAEKSKAAMKN